VNATCETLRLFYKQLDTDFKKSFVDFEPCFDEAQILFEATKCKGLTGTPFLQLMRLILVELGSNGKKLPEAVMVQVDAFRAFLDKATSKVRLILFFLLCFGFSECLGQVKPKQRKFL